MVVVPQPTRPDDEGGAGDNDPCEERWDDQVNSRLPKHPSGQANDFPRQIQGDPDESPGGCSPNVLGGAFVGEGGGGGDGPDEGNLGGEGGNSDSEGEEEGPRGGIEEHGVPGGDAVEESGQEGCRRHGWSERNVMEWTGQ